MGATEAREVRFLRKSLVWVGDILFGVALLMTVFLGSWNTRVSAGAQLANAPPQASSPAWVPLIMLAASIGLIVGGLVGLSLLHRSHRRSITAARPAG